MIRKTFIFVITLLASLSVYSGVKVTSLDLKTNGPTGIINVSLEGRAGELPDLKVNGKTIEITIDGADAFHAISKNINGAQLSANVLNGKAIVKAILPYEIKPDGVDIGWKNKSIEIFFPRGGNAKTANKILSKIENSIPKVALNEDYLNKLVNEEAAKTIRPVVKAPIIETKVDEVKLEQAAIAKPAVVPTEKKSDHFSFAGYAVKFSVFLALVLGLFYGVVQLLKKGVFNRGKLGFLNNAQMIQVLSTTYVAPKRSLMVIKAHKQIFLVANSESGLQFLSEMTDTSGLIKEGEKMVTGTNFDLNLDSAELVSKESDFKLKENINESTPVPEPVGIQALSAKDIVKFSDELKKKARKLKPIEFN